MYHLAPPLTPERFAELCARANRFRAWVDSIRGRNGWASYRPEEIPAELRDVDPSDDEKALIELQEFHARQPERLFCYVTRDGDGWKCSTWPGARYGIVRVGASYKSPAFGRASTRRPVTLYGVNGCVYSGTLYESSGDYARLRKIKATVPAATMEAMRRANFGPGNI